MAAKNGIKKCYSYKRYFERDSYDILKEITIIYRTKNLTVFIWVIK